MNTDVLSDKLKKIEALFSGAATEGERAAAGAAAERIRARLQETTKTEAPTEVRFSIPDPWARKLFVALARRYGLRPYRYPRMKSQSVVVSAPRSFLDGVLRAEFLELEVVLREYLDEQTDRVIREGVHGETADVDEAPLRLR